MAKTQSAVLPKAMKNARERSLYAVACETTAGLRHLVCEEHRRQRPSWPGARFQCRKWRGPEFAFQASCRPNVGVQRTPKAVRCNDRLGNERTAKARPAEPARRARASRNARRWPSAWAEGCCRSWGESAQRARARASRGHELPGACNGANKAGARSATATTVAEASWHCNCMARCGRGGL